MSVLAFFRNQRTKKNHVGKGIKNKEKEISRGVQILENFSKNESNSGLFDLALESNNAHSKCREFV